MKALRCRNSPVDNKIIEDDIWVDLIQVIIKVCMNLSLAHQSQDFCNDVIEFIPLPVNFIFT